MSDDLNKEHQATPYKLSEARKKGQVARSMEITAFFGLTASCMTLIATLSSSAETLNRAASWWMANAYSLSVDDGFLIYSASQYVLTLSKIVLGVIIAGLISSIAAGIIHAGPVFSLQVLSPNFSKLNPASGFKKIFTRKGLVDVLRLILKISMFSFCAYLAWKNVSNVIFTSNHASLRDVLNGWVLALSVFIFSLLSVFFIFAVFDLWFSRREFARQMRMSSREIKDEAKRREGNPEIKAKRKKALNELLARAASVQNVKDSDIIITNPTHVAVALKYRAKTMINPIVVAKGSGLIASFIRREARKYEIPILRRPELARKMLREVGVGENISLEHQRPVAAIYRWLLKNMKNNIFE